MKSMKIFGYVFLIIGLSVGNAFCMDESAAKTGAATHHAPIADELADQAKAAEQSRAQQKIREFFQDIDSPTADVVEEFKTTGLNSTDLIQVKDPSTGSMALHITAQTGNVAGTKKLLELGALVDAKNNNLQTPLFLAARFGNSKEVIEVLLNAGANKDMECGIFQKGTPFSESQDKFKKILEDFKPSPKPGKTGGTAGAGADIKQAEKEFMDALKNHTFDKIPEILGRHPDLATPLHIAALTGNAVEIDALLKEGHADVNTKKVHGYTPLHAAAFSGSVACIEKLLAAGATIDMKNNDGDTALHIAASLVAASLGHIDAVKKLLEKKADVNATQKDGYTPLHVAAFSGSVACIETLLAAGAHINAIDKDKDTPLHVAVIFDHIDVVKKLLAATPGPRLDLKNKNDKTALMLALEYQRVEIIPLLESHAKSAASNPATALVQGLTGLRLQLGNLVTALSGVGKNK